MKVFGRNNIAILATLFLLSYSKALKTIISALSATQVLTSDADNVSAPVLPYTVWSYDGVGDSPLQQQGATPPSRSSCLPLNYDLTCGWKEDEITDAGICRVSAKAGLWTLDWTMDWTMDWNMDSILDSFSSF